MTVAAIVSRTLPTAQRTTGDGPGDASTTVSVSPEANRIQTMCAATARAEKKVAATIASHTSRTA